METISTHHTEGKKISSDLRLISFAENWLLPWDKSILA